MRNLNVKTSALITTVFIAGICSIIYELLISTISSYFLGDSIKQFSVIIGVYLFAMGIGSYISRFMEKRLLENFLFIELLLGFFGGLSVPLLYFVFGMEWNYQYFVIVLVLLIGILTGLEIPLLTRLLEQYYQLRFNLSNVLSLDYLGALLATLLFPFVFLPLFGTFRSSLVFGLINMNIAILILTVFKNDLDRSVKRKLVRHTVVASTVLLAVLLFSKELLREWDNSMYSGKVVYSGQSKYQKIVVTKKKNDVRLYLNGNLQFSSRDEYRYHEPLVHLPMMLKRASNILILGGGDGLVAKELLKYDNVKQITIVDLDPAITNLSNSNFHLKKVNEGSLDNPKVKTINQDAFVFMNSSKSVFDLIIADLPDPNNVSLSRLYSREFYRLVRGHLKENGFFVTQATSTYFTNSTFWCIENTIRSAGFQYTLPFHSYVPSFGDWGFVVAAMLPIPIESIRLDIPTKFLRQETLAQLYNFPKDVIKKVEEVNTMDRPILLDLYLKEWKQWSD